MKLAAPVLSLLLSAPAGAAGLPEIGLALHLLDYLQTKEITKECNNPRDVQHEFGPGYDRITYKDPIYETNPVLGRCPTMGKVNTYFLATGVILYGLSKYGPEEWRPYINGGWIGVEIAATANNYSLGVRVRF